MTKTLLFLAENGMALQVRRGSLCVRDADGTEVLHPARIHGIRTIILAGRGGSITGRALAIRQRQFAAASDPRKRLDVARKIVGVKLRTLGLHPADAAAFREEIAGARSILDLMAAEARAGGAYFLRYRGAELRICGDTDRRDAELLLHRRARPMHAGLRRRRA